MFTPELLGEVTAIAGIVVAITQAVKRLFKQRVDGWIALVISAVLSILLALWRTFSAQPQDWAKFGVIAVGAFLESNGIYHFGATAIGNKAPTNYPWNRGP